MKAEAGMALYLALHVVFAIPVGNHTPGVSLKRSYGGWAGSSKEQLSAPALQAGGDYFLYGE